MTSARHQGNAMPLEQVPFGTNDFAVNPEPRLPCVLLLDVSTSMTGKPIHELNDGVFLYKGELMPDALDAKRVEVALATFGGVVPTLSDFTTADPSNTPQRTP